MPLLEPEPNALRPAATSPAHDRVPDARAWGTPEPLRGDLVALLGAEKVLHTISDLVAYASDASPYRFVPQVVVLAEDLDDISAVFSYAHGKGRNVVFRAAGTSLNGQAQGEDILVDVRRHWTGVEVLDGGARARIRPGTTVWRANTTLARHGRLLGPDPASALACTLGGVVANNASGMTAGTTRNSYRTLASLTLVLPSGTIVDTADPAADAELAQAEPALCAGLLALKAEIEAEPELVARIRAKYRIKNTNGYRLDAFLDGETPAQILRGLVVGSQGTLGFIAETVFDTLPLERCTSTALLFFPTLRDAAAAVPRFNEAGARAVELMDGNTLRASVSVPGVPADWAELPKETAALLVEFRAADESAQRAYEQAAAQALEDRPLVAPVASVSNAFTRDAAAINGYWKARKAFVDRGRRLPAGRHDTDHRGLRGAARPAGRRLRRAAGTPGTARLRRGRRRPRRTRQPALPARLRRRGAGRCGALRRVHGRVLPADRRALRRLAQGRARHRPQHRAVPGAASGARGQPS